jgi:hypothetical protein
MSNPRNFKSRTTASDHRAAGTIACVGGGLMSAGLPGMAHSDSPHPIGRGITR